MKWTILILKQGQVSVRKLNLQQDDKKFIKSRNFHGDFEILALCNDEEELGFKISHSYKRIKYNIICISNGTIHDFIMNHNK